RSACPPLPSPFLRHGRPCQPLSSHVLRAGSAVVRAGAARLVVVVVLILPLVGADRAGAAAVLVFGDHFAHGSYVSGMSVRDTFGRPLRDLRISVTDRCNFRCVYCMPKEVYGRDHRFLERRELLTFEEITRVARIFVAAGVKKLRITGGEPLVRRDLERLIAQLAELDVDLTLTTNGSLLPQKAQTPPHAGPSRLTARP